MIYGSNVNFQPLILGVAGSAAATYAVTFDRLGYDFCQILVQLGSSGTSATDNPSVCLISEATTTNGTTTAVPGGTGDTDFTIPAGLTSLSQVYVINIDCRNRQRYLKLAMTLGAATPISATAILHRAKVVPVSTTEQNAAVIVNL